MTHRKERGGRKRRQEHVMWIGGDSMIHPLLSVPHFEDKTSTTTHIGTLLLASSKAFHVIDKLTFLMNIIDKQVNDHAVFQCVKQVVMVAYTCPLVSCELSSLWDIEGKKGPIEIG